MHKKTHQSRDYLTKSGNHSMTGSRRGFIDMDIVVDKELLHENPDVIFTRLQAAKSALVDERREIEDRLAPRGKNRANWKKRIRLYYKGREHEYGGNRERQQLLRKYFDLGDQVTALVKKQHELKAQCPKISQNRRLPYFFMRAAENILPDDMFQQIKEAAIENYRKEELCRESE